MGILFIKYKHKQTQTQTQTHRSIESGFQENRWLVGILFTKHKYKDKDKHKNHESLDSVKTGSSWGPPSLNTKTKVNTNTSTKTKTNTKTI